MIFLVQYGINKALVNFSKTPNLKNSLVLIYSKLHSKSCDCNYINYIKQTSFEVMHFLLWQSKKFPPWDEITVAYR